MKSSYGLTEEDYEAMLEVQEYTCWICHKDEERKREDGTPLSLSVDHCHVSGRVRGLLCTKCNTALGLFREDVEAMQRAIDYLKMFAPR